jgi:sulfoxide reductase heme-binding subunit YedZ
MGLDGDIGRDILKRPFILVGFACWLLLLPLALTSFNRAMRWLGGRQWQALHRLVY